MVWPEVEQALKNRRYELLLSGEKLRSLFEQKNEFDPTIWTLKQLNFLEISNCALIESLPSSLDQLIHLTTLTLTNNRLLSLPAGIGALSQLRHFNASFNQLEQIDERIFFDLSELETLNLSNNRLKDLPTSFVGEKNKKLAIVNLSHNELHSLPPLCEQLENLSQLDLADNRFEEVPTTIFDLPSLKMLSFESNLLADIPPQLADRPKLKGSSSQSTMKNDDSKSDSLFPTQSRLTGKKEVSFRIGIFR
jgi:Leucine-rich repeat (LRR) protein